MKNPIAIIVSAVLVACVARGDEPPSEHVRKLLARNPDRAARVNGAQMKVTVDEKAAVAADSGPAVTLNWAINYDGPRPPLNILQPSLGPPAFGQTTILFHLIAADGKDYPAVIKAEHHKIPGFYMPPKESFVTVEPKKEATGTITVPWSNVWKSGQERWAKQFAEAGPKAIYVQIRHSPTDRGKQYALDAWTGDLQTELVEVPLKTVGLK